MFTHHSGKNLTAYRLLVALIGCLILEPTVWAKECTPETLANRFPSVESAVTRWSDTHHTLIDPEVKRGLIEELCQAVAAIQSRQGTDDGTIDKAVPEVISEYLDGETDSTSSSVRSVGAILRSALGSSGFSRQQIQRYALLKITYKKPNVTRLDLDGRQLDASELVLAPPGRTEGKGFRDKTVVCRFVVELIAGQPNEVECK